MGKSNITNMKIPDSKLVPKFVKDTSWKKAFQYQASRRAPTKIAKAAKISTEDVILGIGWLFKEGKIKDEDNKVALA